ncbi:DsbA family protein [Dactylosporangium aurantiacum]|uniref:DsbA family protein n=1 Tax=Dactylosporangium aurantiacum TaxID=35754 RepID=A0A9Q9IKY4_9ACTN|nr:DsbA family protein [Dactylosporangium aurantiacum]MDG6104237.1 DsbA family protein [Dactylosporangium aurantiacum]UWZ56763.1 DsbA family protein [Dactylosporangium aurantiacum]
MTPTVVEYTDPMCPWAWGSEPTFRRLRELTAARFRWRRVYGILFDLDDDPPPDPDAEAAWYHRFVRDVSGHTGAPCPARLERVAVSSWPASLGAKAAARQGLEDVVLRRLREAMFLRGEPADTPERVLAAAAAVPGLDLARLARDLASPEVAAAVRADWLETRRPAPEVIGLTAPGPHCGAAKEIDGGLRYALPTLLFEGPLGRQIVPGWRPLRQYLDAAERVAPA